MHFDPALFERRPRLFRQPVTERREDLLATLEQNDPHIGRIEAPEVVLQSPPRELRDLSRDLDTGRPAADDHEGQPRPTGVEIVLQLGHLEGAEDPLALHERVGEGLHARRPLGKLVVTEVRLPDACRDHQAIVRESCPPPIRTDDGYRLLDEVEIGHVAELHLRVRCFRSTSRVGAVTAPGERMPVATW